MLSSGEVSNLYKTDEFEDVSSICGLLMFNFIDFFFIKIKNKIYHAATKAGVPITNEAMHNFFVERVRAHMHIVLCMSPIGEAFRNRLRQYPALVNCTTIDWFCDWPKEALLEVAYKYISDVNFVETITGEQVNPTIILKVNYTQ